MRARLGVLTTSYPRWDGDAAGHFVASLTRWLEAHDVAVEVLCAAADNPLFYRGGAPTQLRSARAWAAATRWSARLFAEAFCRRKAWDGVVSHWLLPCGMVGDRLGLPHLAIAHGSDVALVGELPGGRSWVRRLAKRADLVYVAAALRDATGAPGRVVPMGVDAQALAGGDPARVPIDGKVALVLSRLVYEKGIDRAIEALPEGVTLVVAGDGPERARLEALARRRAVRFVGEVAGQAKRDLLARADLLVVPSRSDGAPTVIAEAAAVGLPIVACPVGGIAELAAPGCVLVSPEQLRDGMARALLLGRGAPPPEGAWPHQNAQAERLFAPFLPRIVTRQADDCCETVTRRL